MSAIGGDPPKPGVPPAGTGKLETGKPHAEGEEQYAGDAEKVNLLRKAEGASG